VGGGGGVGVGGGGGLGGGGGWGGGGWWGGGGGGGGGGGVGTLLHIRRKGPRVTGLCSRFGKVEGSGKKKSKNVLKKSQTSIFPRWTYGRGEAEGRSGKFRPKRERERGEMHSRQLPTKDQRETTTKEEEEGEIHIEGAVTLTGGKKIAVAEALVSHVRREECATRQPS